MHERTLQDYEISRWPFGAAIFATMFVRLGSFTFFPRGFGPAGDFFNRPRFCVYYQSSHGREVGFEVATAAASAAALHTGEPIVERTGYVGMDVHRAARIGAAAHGGQILVSGSTRELVAADMPTGLELLPLGSYRLKDVRQPVELYQVRADGLQADFPALRTQSAGDEPPTPGEPPFKGLEFFDETDARLFFGRETLTADLVERLGSGTFMAVVGASGSGKSSLVRAGVVPAVREQNQTDWTIRTFTPTARPLEALALALTTRDAATGRSASPRETATLIDDLSADRRTLHLFARQRIGAARGRDDCCSSSTSSRSCSRSARDEADRPPSSTTS